MGANNFSSENQISNQQITTNVTSVPTVSFLSTDELISRVGEELKKVGEGKTADLLRRNDFSIWWISPDNLNIQIENSPGVELQIKCDGADTSNLRNMLSSLISIVDKLLSENGYKLNDLNSSKSVSDSRFYDYIRAYEKGEEKCVLRGNPDCEIASIDKYTNRKISFACSDQYEKNYQEQAPYLKDLNLKNEVIAIRKKVGDFVDLSVRGRRTGYYIIAKKIDGKWKAIGGGHDAIPCEIVDQYQIPKEIVEKCFSSEKNELIPNNL